MLFCAQDSTPMFTCLQYRRVNTPSSSREANCELDKRQQETGNGPDCDAIGQACHNQLYTRPGTSGWSCCSMQCNACQMQRASSVGGATGEARTCENHGSQALRVACSQTGTPTSTTSTTTTTAARSHAVRTTAVGQLINSQTGRT